MPQRNAADHDAQVHLGSHVDSVHARLRESLQDLRVAVHQQMVGHILDASLAALKARLWHSSGCLVHRRQGELKGHHTAEAS